MSIKWMSEDLSQFIYPRFHLVWLSDSEDSAVKAKPDSPPPASSSAIADVQPNAASSPREEPNGLEDPVNGAPAKRPLSPPQEDLAKRHKEAEVRRTGAAVCVCVNIQYIWCLADLNWDFSFLLQVSNDDSAFKEPYPPSSESCTHGEGPNIVGVIYSSCCWGSYTDRRRKNNHYNILPLHH